MVKLGEGLDFTLKDFGFIEDSRIPMQLHETPLKSLRVIANTNQVIMRVSYVIKSNNYASNLSNFLLVKKSSGIKIKKCQICKSTRIIVKNKNGIDDYVAYNGETDVSTMKEIVMKNKDENDV